MEAMELTDIEKKLFKINYPNEDQIEEGFLFGYQKDALEYFREADRYLKEKYPSFADKFEYLSFSSASRLNPAAKLIFKYDNLDGFSVFTEKKEGVFECQDTFYNCIIGKEYDEKIEEILKKDGYEVVSHTVFLNSIGKDVDEKASINDFMENYPGISRRTALYVKDTANEDIAKGIEGAVRKSGIYGAYAVYVVPETEGKTEDELKVDRGLGYTFNTF